LTNLNLAAEAAMGELLRQQDPTLLYDFVRCIGKGSYGKVYKAVSKTNKLNTVAFKVLPLEDGAQSITTETQRELNSLRECQHPRVVRYHGAYIQESRLWIAMEFCCCSVHAILRRTKRPLSEAQIATICSEALCGLQYLHSHRQIIHRDVKAGNILLTELGEVKLADFGVSAQLTGGLTKRNTVIGTPMWMSPEMIEAGQYDHRTDIWSLGITAIELAETQPPLHDVTPSVRVLFLIPSKPPPTLEHPEHWSSEFRDFLRACLMKDPTQRPDAPGALLLPFLKTVRIGTALQDLVKEHILADRLDRPDSYSPGSTLQSTLRAKSESKSGEEKSDSTLNSTMSAQQRQYGGDAQSTLSSTTMPALEKAGMPVDDAQQLHGVEHDTLKNDTSSESGYLQDFAFMHDYEQASPMASRRESDNQAAGAPLAALPAGPRLAGTSLELPECRDATLVSLAGSMRSSQLTGREQGSSSISRLPDTPPSTMRAGEDSAALTLVRLPSMMQQVSWQLVDPTGAPAAPAAELQSARELAREHEPPVTAAPDAAAPDSAAAAPDTVVVSSVRFHGGGTWPRKRTSEARSLAKEASAAFEDEDVDTSRARAISMSDGAQDAAAGHRRNKSTSSMRNGGHVFSGLFKRLTPRSGKVDKLSVYEIAGVESSREEPPSAASL